MVTRAEVGMTARDTQKVCSLQCQWVDCLPINTCSNKDAGIRERKGPKPCAINWQRERNETRERDTETATLKKLVTIYSDYSQTHVTITLQDLLFRSLSSNIENRVVKSVSESTNGRWSEEGKTENNEMSYRECGNRLEILAD